MKSNYLLAGLLLAFIFTGCSASSAEPAQLENTKTNTATLEPTATFTPAPTPTPTETPIPSPTPFAGGGKISFWGKTGPDDTNKLYLANPDGSEPRMIFDPQEYGHAADDVAQYDGKFGGSWSADGQFLLFYLVNREAQYYLYLYDDAAGSVEPLASQIITINADWLNNNSVFFNQEGKLNIVKINDPIEIEKIPYPDQAGFPLGAGPDDGIVYLETGLAAGNTILMIGGEYILYLDAEGNMQNDESPSEFALKTINTSGETSPALDENPELNLAFQGLTSNPEINHQAIYFLSIYNQDNLPDTATLYRYELTSQTLENLISFPPGRALGLASFSPNGQYVWINNCENVYYGTSNCTDSILDLNTLEAIHEFDIYSIYSSPTWSPDNNYVLFIRDDNNGKLTLSRLEIATGEISTIIEGFEYFADPAWGR